MDVREYSYGTYCTVLLDAVSYATDCHHHGGDKVYKIKLITKGFYKI